MHLVIRTLYNNSDWSDRCTEPYEDSLCFDCCKENPSFCIEPPEPTDRTCGGICWEQNLCKKCRWGCFPPGDKWGERAEEDMEVHLVYGQPDGRYTLWAKTRIWWKAKRPAEDGYYYLYFRPFRPLPEKERIPNLTDIQLVGEIWGRNRYRYVE